RHVHGEGAVPDLLRRGAADAGDRGAIAGGAVVRDAVDGLGAAALGEQVEEVVGDARRVVHVQVAHARGPAVGGRAVLGGLVHVPQRGAVAVDVDLLADQVVAHVRGVGGVELDVRPHDVGGGLVQAARLTGVDEARGVGGHAVGHLVAGHVDGGQRLGVEVAVAVGHAEAGVVPERVDVGVAVVDAVVRAHAVVADAAAPVDVLVIVPGHRGAVLRVDGGGLRVGGQPVAPHVIRFGEQGAGAGGEVGQVVGLLVAAGGVLELVGAA